MTPEQVIDKQLGYYNNRDVAGFASMYSKGIKIYDQGDRSPRISGLEELKEVYSKTFAVSELHAGIEKRIVFGSFVIDHEKVRRVLDNEEKYSQAVVTYEVREGLIQNVWIIRETMI